MSISATTSPVFRRAGFRLTDGVVSLRPWHERDLPLIYRAVQDPLIPRFTSVPAHQSVEQLRAVLARNAFDREDGMLIAIVNQDNVLQGSCSFLSADWKNQTVDVGYWVAWWARGQGIAARAAALLSEFALTELGFERVGLAANIENVASQRSAEKAGFTFEGVKRSALLHQGEMIDLACYSRVRADLHP